MHAIYPLVIGCGVFVLSTLTFGIFLRKHPTKKVAEITSMIMHFLLLITLLIPTWGWSYLWGTHYDELLGVPSLPFRMAAGAIGAVMMLAGLLLMSIGSVVLLECGKGIPAFELTKELVGKYIYKRTRNPMALGFCLISIAIGLLAGSTFFTLWSLSVVTPSLIFYLKYFEECELEIRFGSSYSEYKRKVSFLFPSFHNIL